MKATIFKDDQFETVGLIVKSGNAALVTWGLTCEQMYYTKTIDAEKYADKVLELIKLQTLSNYYHWDFVREVCEIAADPRNLAKRKNKKDASVFIEHDKYKELDEKIERIVKAIK